MMKFIKNSSGLKFWFEKKGEKIWVHFDGHTFVLKRKIKEAFLNKKKKETSFSPSFKASFPGRILSIKVQKGDPVSAYQHLIIIESMKIEHTLSVPYSARIKSICVREGESVDIDQELIQFDKL